MLFNSNIFDKTNIHTIIVEPRVKLHLYIFKQIFKTLSFEFLFFNFTITITLLNIILCTAI